MMKGLDKEKTGRQQCGGDQRETGVGQVGEGLGDINGDRRRLGLVWSTHNATYR